MIHNGAGYTGIPPRCSQEEDASHQGGDGEVQGRLRGHGQEAASRDCEEGRGNILNILSRQ